MPYSAWLYGAARLVSIVEHASGDSATAAEAQQLPLTQVFGEIWCNYSMNRVTEEPVIYRIDLAQLPR